MVEFAPLAPAEGTAAGSLVDLLIAGAGEHPKQAALLHRRSGRRERISMAALLDEVRALAAGIAAAGVQPGDRVGVVAEPSAAWLAAECACWYAGAVVVPLDPASPSARAEWALSDSGAVAVFLSQGRARQVYDSVADRLPNVRHAWTLRDDDLDRLAEHGNLVGDDDLEARRSTIGADNPAIILYGPGGSEAPLGAILSHGACRYAIDSATALLRDLPQPESTRSAVVALRSTQALSRVFSLACLQAEMPLGFGVPGADLLDVLDDWQPTVLASDPATIELTLGAAEDRGRQAARPWVIDAAAAAARLALLDRSPRPRLPSLLGGNIAAMLCAGGVLAAKQEQLLRSAGIAIHQTFGTPQTCGLVGFGQAEDDDALVVQPVPGTDVRCEGAEILVRGRQVFDGYFNDWRASAAAFTGDGWLRTGHCGTCGSDAAAMHITGRIDGILQTSGGADVAAEPVEERLRSSTPLISECIVVGANRPHLTALVLLDRSRLRTWLGKHGRSPETSEAEMVEDPELLADLHAAVAVVNAHLSPSEQIRDCRVVLRSAAGAGLTPSAQNPRTAIMRDLRDTIATLPT